MIKNTLNNGIYCEPLFQTPNMIFKAAEEKKKEEEKALKNKGKKNKKDKNKIGDCHYWL